MFHAAVAVAISSAAGGALASSHPARTVKVKPTIVLVHGSWADSPSWNSEVTALERLGCPVIALANPLRDLASDAAYAHSIRRTIKSPIVPRRSFLRWCCDYERIGVPNIKALVYIAGFAPNRGELVEQLVAKNPGSEIMRNLITHTYPLPGGGEGTDLYLTDHGFCRDRVCKRPPKACR